MGGLCYRCKGKGVCGKPCRILAALKRFQPRVKLEFSGSAPEIFIGRHNYPDVNTGILSPNEYGSTERLSMPEIWFREQSSIEEILQFRSQMVYSRFKSNIKTGSRFLNIMQEIALASKPVATEFKLRKRPVVNFHLEFHMPMVGNPAPLEKVRLEENPKVEKKVDYITSDYDFSASDAIKELYTGRIAVSNIIKILAAGLLGLKFQRKLVSSRWATTATDDTISKFLIEKIKTYPQISEFLLFHSQYLGNHYELLLLPSHFEFEVIEAKMPGSVWNPDTANRTYFAQDYENYFGRKDYAAEVTGAYYANRLAVSEYLQQIKRQASCIVMRECREEYWAPCGVGILREAARAAFEKKPETFSTLEGVLQSVQTRMKLSIKEFLSKSVLIPNFKTQKRISEFLSK